MSRCDHTIIKDYVRGSDYLVARGEKPLNRLRLARLGRRDSRDGVARTRTSTLAYESAARREVETRNLD
eukprot:scaffold510413_cov23-Prasinocladus_malaysianus.AAC.1